MADRARLAEALALSTDYVALVASARRASVVLAALRERGSSEEELARVRSPAGLDLGPCTQEEIAVAVLAELVAWRHARMPQAAPNLTGCRRAPNVMPRSRPRSTACSRRTSGSMACERFGGSSLARES